MNVAKTANVLIIIFLAFLVLGFAYSAVYGDSNPDFAFTLFLLPAIVLPLIGVVAAVLVFIHIIAVLRKKTRFNKITGVLILFAIVLPPVLGLAKSVLAT